jgi:hypothetical protein
MNVGRSVRQASRHLTERYDLSVAYVFFFASFFFSPWNELRNVLYAFVLVPFILTLRLDKLKSYARSTVFVFSMTYLAYMLLTLAWAKDTTLSHAAEYGLWSISLFVLFGATSDLLRKDPSFVDRLYRWLCWTAGIVAIISVAHYYSAHTVFGEFPPTRLQGSGIFHNAVRAGYAYGTVALICYYGFLKKGHRRNNRRNTTMYAAIFLVAISTVLMTQSRGPLLSLIAALLVGEATSRNWRTLILLVAAPLLYVSLSMSFGIDALNLFQRGDSYRMEIWMQVLERVRTDMWFGLGLAAETDFVMADGRILHNPHSAFMATLLYGGIVGTVALIAMLLAAFYQAVIDYFRTDDFTLAALMIFVFFSILPHGTNLVAHPKPLWLYIWLPIALAGSRELSGITCTEGRYREKGASTESTWSGKQALQEE